MAKVKKPENLREACVAEAVKIIDTQGVENLSLRDVARRLGVSHQAPYKHFESRNHILAEIVRRAFASFADFLRARPVTGDPRNDLAAMGRAYLSFAETYPLQYRLMLNTQIPHPNDFPDMMESARDAFSLLIDALEKLPSARRAPDRDTRIDFDALFIISVLHGFSSMHGSPIADTMRLTPDELEAASPEILQRIGRAINKDQKA